MRREGQNWRVILAARREKSKAQTKIDLEQTHRSLRLGGLGALGAIISLLAYNAGRVKAAVSDVFPVNDNRNSGISFPVGSLAQSVRNVAPQFDFFRLDEPLTPPKKQAKPPILRALSNVLHHDEEGVDNLGLSEFVACNQGTRTKIRACLSKAGLQEDLIDLVLSDE